MEKNLKTVCDEFETLLLKEAAMALQRSESDDSRFDAGCAKGLEWAHKWFVEQFKPQLKP